MIADVMVPLMFIVMALTFGSVALLRPLVKPLADLLTAMAQERRQRLSTPDDFTESERHLLDINRRLARLEAQQNARAPLRDPSRPDL